MKLIDCSKSSSVLSKRIDDAKRKQSIYSQISHNCYAVGGSNTGQKHSKIIDFSLGFREAFSLLPFCLCGFIWSNTIKMGGFGKDTCFSDEIQCPYEGSVDNGGHSLRTEKIFVGKPSSGFPEDINREDEVTLTSVSCVQPRLNAQIY